MHAETRTRVSISSSHQITGLLQAWSQGDETALAELTPLVHAELYKLARGYMGRERRDHSLQATGSGERVLPAARGRTRGPVGRTALISLPCRRVSCGASWWTSPAHASTGNAAVAVEHVALDEQALAIEPGRDLVALDDALSALAIIDERKSRIVELRFFGGLSHEETAEALGVSAKTVLREWQVAKVWLLRELSKR